MFFFAPLLTGMLIAVMIAINGALSAQYGVYSATVIIHVAGLLLIGFVSILKKDKLFYKGIPKYLYLGGALGVALTACNNIAFARIGVSTMLALGLFAQSLAGLAVDKYGIMGMKKCKVGKRKLIGLTLTLAGIAVMTERFDALAVTLSLLAGVMLLVARTLNAQLAQKTSLRTSTIFNYIVGLAVAIPTMLLLGRQEPAFVALTLSPQIWMYLGGIIGVVVVLLLNATVTRVPAFSLSLFLFIGQVFMGILIDALLLGAFSARLLLGGLLVAVGLAIDAAIERKACA